MLQIYNTTQLICFLFWCSNCWASKFAWTICIQAPQMVVLRQDHLVCCLPTFDGLRGIPSLEQIGKLNYFNNVFFFPLHIYVIACFWQELLEFNSLWVLVFSQGVSLGFAALDVHTLQSPCFRHLTFWMDLRCMTWMGFLVGLIESKFVLTMSFLWFFRTFSSFFHNSNPSLSTHETKLLPPPCHKIVNLEHLWRYWINCLLNAKFIITIS